LFGTRGQVLPLSSSLQNDVKEAGGESGTRFRSYDKHQNTALALNGCLNAVKYDGGSTMRKENGRRVVVGFWLLFPLVIF